MGFTCEMAALSPDGTTRAELSALQARADRAAAQLPNAGFAAALDGEIAAEHPSVTDAERVVVLGIGGSALGARALDNACGGAARPLEVVDNIDPDAFEAAWAGGNPAKTHWVAISKSGGTTETLAQLSVVRERSRLAGFTPRITLVTGASGALRELASAEELPVFDFPEEVGGRFSVFTSAATVPLALVGHDVGALLTGAKMAREHCTQAGGAAARLAAFLIAAAQDGRNVVTFWSYAERLETIGEWFRQLWAESLGKRDASGTPVGQSPLHCVGSTDQHSIQQLMVEGPPDKVVLVLAHAKAAGLRVPEDGLGAGAGHCMDVILDAMRRATTAGMVRAGCPAMTLRLDDATLESAGALLMTFMAATIIAGELLGVDPYGQPGVEAAKIATKQLLTDPGGTLDREIAVLLGEGEGIRVP